MNIHDQRENNVSVMEIAVQVSIPNLPDSNRSADKVTGTWEVFFTCNMAGGGEARHRRVVC